MTKKRKRRERECVTASWLARENQHGRSERDHICHLHILSLVAPHYSASDRPSFTPSIANCLVLGFRENREHQSHLCCSLVRQRTIPPYAEVSLQEFDYSFVNVVVLISLKTVISFMSLRLKEQLFLFFKFLLLFFFWVIFLINN